MVWREGAASGQGPPHHRKGEEPQRSEGKIVPDAPQLPGDYRVLPNLAFGRLLVAVAVDHPRPGRSAHIHQPLQDPGTEFDALCHRHQQEILRPDPPQELRHRLPNRKVDSPD